MSEAIQNKRRRWPFTLWIAALIAIVGTLYPLSAGPALWAGRNEVLPWSEDAVLRFYHPIEWGYTVCPTPIRVVMEWYRNFWLGSSAMPAGASARPHRSSVTPATR